MTRLRSLIVCAGGFLGLSASALLAAPPVLDRVPDDAAIVIAAPSADSMHRDITSLLTAVEFPFPMPEVNDLLAMMGVTGGIDTSKSIAIVVYPPKKDAAVEVKKAADPMGDDADGDIDDEDEEGDELVVALVPISNYGDLLANFAVKPGEAGSIDQVALPDGTDGFFKDVGNGYAAMSDNKELLGKFKAQSGASPIKNKLGKTGGNVADSADLMAIINVDAIRDKWPEIKKEMEEQIKAETAMLPMGAEANPLQNEAVMWFLDTAVRDSRAIVSGLNASNKGFSVDIAVNFNEGSYMGRMFESGGKTRELLSKIPGGAYIFAGAMDTASPGLRQFVKDIVAKATKPGEEPMFSLASLEKSEGSAFMMGLPKGGVFGGLMTGMIQYVKTSDPAGYIQTAKDDMIRMNGKDQNGVTLETKYTENGAKVDGKDVDVWEMKFAGEGSNQEAAQAMGMIFGPTGGPNGYIARADGGVLLTFSKNSELLTQAIGVAKGEGASLGSDTMIQQVAASLPGSRLGEFYLGTKSLMDLVLPFAAMAGVQIPGDKIPENMPPIGAALASEGGGAHFSLFVPAPVIKTFMDIGMAVQEQMGGGFDDGDDMDDAPPPADGGKGETGQPRF